MRVAIIGPSCNCKIYYIISVKSPVGLPRIGLGLQDPQPCVLPLYYSPLSNDVFVGRAAENPLSAVALAEAENSVYTLIPFVVFFCRGAGNRTRSTRTRSVRTTGILHPEKRTPLRIVRTTGILRPEKRHLGTNPNKFFIECTKQEQIVSQLDPAVLFFVLSLPNIHEQSMPGYY